MEECVDWECSTTGAVWTAYPLIFKGFTRAAAAGAKQPSDPLGETRLVLSGTGALNQTFPDVDNKDCPT